MRYVDKPVEAAPGSLTATSRHFGRDHGRATVRGSSSAWSRLVVGDSGALFLANAAFLVTGVIRMKLAATHLDLVGFGIVSQLTQLTALVVFISGLGVGTGTRLVVARLELPEQVRLEAAKAVSALLVPLAVGLTGLTAVLAEPIAQALLGSSEASTELRIAVLGVPFAVGAQIMMAAGQGWSEFREIVRAGMLTAAVSGLATAALVATGDATIAVASIPVAAVLQCVAVIVTCKSARRLLAATPRITRAVVHDVAAVGVLSFILGGAALAAEAGVRAAMVAMEGLPLVAAYQPLYLLSSSGFGFLLGAVGTAVLVRIAQREPGAASLVEGPVNDVLIRAILAVGALGFIVQAFAGIYVPLLFTETLTDASGSALAYQMPAETIRACTWVLGSVLLSLSLRRYWVTSGLVTVGVQLAVIVIALPNLKLGAVPLASALAWSAGLAVAAHALRQIQIRLRRVTFVLLLWTVVLQLISASATHARPIPNFQPASAAVCAVWAAPVIVVVYRSRVRS